MVRVVLKNSKENMNDKKLIIAITLISIIVLVGGAYFLGKGEKNTSQIVASSYTQNDQNKPRVESKETSFNLGKMKVSDERSHDFVIKNTGTKPLQLSNIRSSCMCTAGKVIYKDSESQEFGMHAERSFIGEILPGDEATIRVTYRPFQMPVYGPIEREVYMTTNDPLNQQLTFKVTTIVE